MNDDSTGDRLYSLGASSHLLNVSVWTLRAHARRGSLKTIRVGRRVLVSTAELQRVVKAGLPSLRQEAEGEQTETKGG
jgi:excisionase family DNA binding protein